MQPLTFPENTWAANPQQIALQWEGMTRSNLGPYFLWSFQMGNVCLSTTAQHPLSETCIGYLYIQVDNYTWSSLSFVKLQHERVLSPKLQTCYLQEVYHKVGV